MGWIVLLALFLLIPVIWVIINYNRMARIRQHIRESWSDIDVELRRRYELIPNLVATVRGYARHERDVLESVTRLRETAVANIGRPASQASDESALMVGVKQLLAIVEDYPDLKADEHFLALQDELSLTEDRIAAARRFFNANVREMNQLVEMVPTNVVASFFGFKREDYFELSAEAERVAPVIDLSGSASGVP